jgi:hypothetical protein
VGAVLLALIGSRELWRWRDRQKPADVKKRYRQA